MHPDTNQWHTIGTQKIHLPLPYGIQQRQHETPSNAGCMLLVFNERAVRQFLQCNVLSSLLSSPFGRYLASHAKAHSMLPFPVKHRRTKNQGANPLEITRHIVKERSPKA